MRGCGLGYKDSAPKPVQRASVSMVARFQTEMLHQGSKPM